MPFDYGLRLNNRQRIANARERPIEANKNQSVDGAEGLFLRSGSPQNVYLVPQRQNFSLERYPRPKQIFDYPNNEPDKISHPATASPDSRSTASQIEFATGTGVETQIKTFLKGAERLAILELTEISNTKATLRITEQYLSTIMAWARKHRQARKVLIVLEEAHTIIPETFSSGFDGDTQWVVSRIGQIALQGRKYGVGLLVISQRTALVSKTILSQCNTFLTHSLIDQTSLTFLESVYSSQHVRSIPNLGRFEFLAAGKAIKAERPILLCRPFDQAKKDASDALRQPPPAPPGVAQPEQSIFG